MISHCANDECGKPLHYLREGRIFVFDMPDARIETMNGKSANRLGHYWLCGSCAKSFTLRQNLVYGVELFAIETGDSHVAITSNSTKITS